MRLKLAFVLKIVLSLDSSGEKEPKCPNFSFLYLKHKQEFLQSKLKQWYIYSDIRKTAPSHTSDMREKTLSVLAN